MKYPDFQWCRGRASTTAQSLQVPTGTRLTKETGECCGQGFTSGPADMSVVCSYSGASAGSPSTAMGPLLRVNTDTVFQRSVKGLLSSLKES